MSTYSFANLSSVKYGTTNITKVMQGVTQVWPTTWVYQPSMKFPAGTNAAFGRLIGVYDALGDLTGETLPHLDIPFGQYKVWLPEYDAGWNYGAEWVVDSKGRVVGHSNPTSVPSSDGSLQTRYGGEWILPNNLPKGTKLYVAVGSGFGFEEEWFATITVV